MSGVGIVGAGAMGSGFAERLLARGHQVRVWNRTHAALEPLVALGAVAAQSPAEVAADSDFVITIVRDAVALAAVSEGTEGIVAGAHSQLVAIEMSTVGPDAIRALRETLPASTALLDAPVHGPPASARAGSLAIFVGGKTPLAAQAQRRRPVVESGDYSASFRLSLARKDMDLVAETAQRAGLDLRLGEAGRSWLLDAEHDGRGEHDYAAIIATIQERARTAPTTEAEPG